MATQFERELAAFRRELPTLLADPLSRGRYALVRGDEVAGVYETFDAALEMGYERYNLDPFMVKQVVEYEVPRYFSRNVKPCR